MHLRRPRSRRLCPKNSRPTKKPRTNMAEPVHVAITRRIRKECVGDYEKALAEFARRSLLEPGARGVQCLYPPPGSSSTEYGVLRTFASAKDRDAFYQSPLYKEWVAQIAPWI